MAQDEHFLNSSNSGGSGGGHGGGDGSYSNNDNNKSRNVKQKKVPQRGLGVAQLERLRLEEQRNREAIQAAHDPPQPPNFVPNMIPVQAVNALTNNAIGGLAHDPPQSPNYIPDMIPVPPAPVNLNFGPPPSAINLYTPVVDPSSPPNVFSWSRVRIGGYNSNNNNTDGGEGDKQRVDHHDVGFTFSPQINLNLQYEPNSPGLSVFESGPQRSFQFQRPPSSSLNGLGMKRAYPFNLERPPAPMMPSFLSNFHASGSRSDKFRSCINEPGTKSIRDGQLILTSGPEQNPVEDTRLIGDFLTLAPPVAASTPLNKQPVDLGRRGLELSDNRTLSSQGFRSHQAHRVGSSSSTEQSFSFFPIRPQTDQTRANVRNAGDNNEEKEEKIDLDLKL